MDISIRYIYTHLQNICSAVAFSLNNNNSSKKKKKKKKKKMKTVKNDKKHNKFRLM